MSRWPSRVSVARLVELRVEAVADRRRRRCARSGGSSATRVVEQRAQRPRTRRSTARLGGRRAPRARSASGHARARRASAGSSASDVAQRDELARRRRARPRASSRGARGRATSARRVADLGAKPGLRDEELDRVEPAADLGDVASAARAGAGAAGARPAPSRLVDLRRGASPRVSPSIVRTSSRCACVASSRTSVSPSS